MKQWPTAGQCHWLARADVEPPSRCYVCKSGRDLIQPVPPGLFVPMLGPPLFRVLFHKLLVPNPSRNLRRLLPSILRPSALTARALAVETRSANIETELRAGSSRILARLDDRSSCFRIVTVCWPMTMVARLIGTPEALPAN